MDNDYIVEIEYTAKTELSIKALSKQWAEIVAKEQWAKDRLEPMTIIGVQEKHGH